MVIKQADNIRGDKKYGWNVYHKISLQTHNVLSNVVLVQDSTDLSNSQLKSTV